MPDCSLLSLEVCLGLEQVLLEVVGPQGQHAPRLLVPLAARLSNLLHVDTLGGCDHC